MRSKLVIMLLFITVLLVGCGNNSANDDILPTDFDANDIKELVNDYSVRNITDHTASITATQLIITDEEEKQSVYDLPNDEFFVSIAPFINETHPCTDHSLTGCQGELVDKDFDFHIEDEDGNVVLNETMNSGENGFIDIWLPRDETFQVKVTHDGKETESEISTFKGDGTCITTMQLM